MSASDAPQLILIRHGPTDRPGRLCGRTDVGLAADITFPDPAGLGEIAELRVSPAKRARATAAGLWPGHEMVRDARLWEQDFGGWENMAYDALPDVGALSRQELADLSGPGGENMRDVVTRVRPAFDAAARAAQHLGAIAIVAHAGVIRAGLAIALDSVEVALAFEVDHLSVTRLRCLSGGGFSVISVNGRLP